MPIPRTVTEPLNSFKYPRNKAKDFSLGVTLLAVNS